MSNLISHVPVWIDASCVARPCAGRLKILFRSWQADRAIQVRTIHTGGTSADGTFAVRVDGEPTFYLTAEGVAAIDADSLRLSPVDEALLFPRRKRPARKTLPPSFDRLRDDWPRSSTGRQYSMSMLLTESGSLQITQDCGDGELRHITFNPEQIDTVLQWLTEAKAAAQA